MKTCFWSNIYDNNNNFGVLLIKYSYILLDTWNILWAMNLTLLIHKMRSTVKSENFRHVWHWSKPILLIDISRNTFVLPICISSYSFANLANSSNYFQTANFFFGFRKKTALLPYVHFTRLMVVLRSDVWYRHTKTIHLTFFFFLLLLFSN